MLLLFGIVLAALLTSGPENGGYVGTIDSLAGWSLLFMFPLYAVRLAATKWSIIPSLLPSPVAHSAAFVIAIVISWANRGTGNNLRVPGLEPCVRGSGHHLRYVCRMDATEDGQFGLRLEVQWDPEGHARPCVPPCSSRLAQHSRYLALLNDLPAINALMLDYVETEEIGRLYQPYVAAIYDTRSLIAFLFFVVVLALALPQAAWRLPRWEARPLLSAIGFAFAGCLAWLLGLAMADLGYGYALGGSVAGAGFFSIAITQMGLQFSGESDSVMADAIRWMAESKTRSFMPGAAIAIYALLLRPVIYDTLALAAVLEWLAVLAAIVGVILRMRSRLQTDINVVEAGAAPTIDWSRHEQHLETLPDPRAATVYNVRQAWIRMGDPSGFWTYMMGLLCREGASPESVRRVMSPLRDGYSRGNANNRYTALSESFLAAKTGNGGINKRRGELHRQPAGLECARRRFRRNGRRFRCLRRIRHRRLQPPRRERWPRRQPLFPPHP